MKKKTTNLIAITSRWTANAGHAFCAYSWQESFSTEQTFLNLNSKSTNLKKRHYNIFFPGVCLISTTRIQELTQKLIPRSVLGSLWVLLSMRIHNKINYCICICLHKNRLQLRQIRDKVVMIVIRNKRMFSMYQCK